MSILIISPSPPPHFLMTKFDSNSIWVQAREKKAQETKNVQVFSFLMYNNWNFFKYFPSSSVTVKFSK